MKLSISLSESDVAALDAHVRQAGLPSRSAAVQQAIRALAHPHLGEAYAAAWAEWDGTGERDLWEGAAADGLQG